MSRRYFGTDGIRGRANTFPMTTDVAVKVAMAAAAVLRNQSGKPHNKVVIGKDTRLSCYMLEQAMASGFLAMGMDVIMLGPLPTPAVANLTRSLRADLGVMISASHNPYEDNGIKLFGHDGYKLSDDTERAIEAAIDTDLYEDLSTPEDIGQASRLEDASGRYIEFAKASLPRGMRLDGLKIVVDCANGAAYKVAPKVLWELGADVITIGVTPNGKNINDGCGATHTGPLQDKVVAEKADLGIALDGDADRLIMVDQNGRRVDGDQLMAVIARDWATNGWLTGGGVVATVMSNLGLERYLKSLSLTLERTAVGDRYVVERMRETGMNLGGEQSGHMVMADYATTGDGLLAAIQVLAIMKRAGKDIATLAHVFETVPQFLENVRLGKGSAPAILSHKDVAAMIENSRKSLADTGRILVRPSGTEPLIRVMAEGDNEAQVKSIIADICGAIQKIA